MRTYSKISTVGLFCYDKFVETPKQKFYFNENGIEHSKKNFYRDKCTVYVVAKLPSGVF